MRFATAIAAAGFAAGVVAQNATVSDVYVTEVVTALTTYCPEATELTHAGQTYTVSEATSLTILQTVRTPSSTELRTCSIY